MGQKDLLVMGIDIGLKNLAICVMDQNLKIHYWDNGDLITKSPKESSLRGNKHLITKLVVSHLDKLNDKHKELLTKLNHVFIETQPKKNCLMSFVSAVVFTKITDLLINQKTKVKFMSPRNKLKINYTGENLNYKVKSKYSQRKKMAIDYTRWVIRERIPEECKISCSLKLESSKKKDDLADCCLMCVYYLDNNLQ